MTGQTRDSMFFGDSRQCARSLRRQAPGAAHVDVETRLRCCNLNIERLCFRRQSFGDVPGHLDCALEAGSENGTMINAHDVVSMECGKPHLQDPVGRSASVEDCASPSLAVSVDKRVDLGAEADLRKSGYHQISLPGTIAIFAPVLQCAAATDPEMRTNRRDALGAWLLNAQQMTPIGMALPRFDLLAFARQRVRNIDRPSGTRGNSIAAVTETLDQNPLNHTPHPAKIRDCRHRRAQAKKSHQLGASRAIRPTQSGPCKPLRESPDRERCLVWLRGGRLRIAA